MRDWRIIVLALSLWSFFSCSKESALPQEQRALQFSTVESKSNLSLLFTTFKVWGEVCVASSSEPLIQGYRVNYINNNNQWSYTQGEGTEGQEMKYWSYSADEYRFHAGAPDYVTNASGQQVAGIVRNAGTPAITENSLTLKMIATKEIKETSLYSQPYLVRRTDPSFGSLVNLKFCYAHAKVNVAFKYVSGSTITIKEIKLIPPAAIATEATLQIKYDWAKPAVSAGTLDISAKGISTSSPLEFNPIENISANSKEYHSSSPWYLIPDPASKGDWKLSITVASEGVADVTKEVTFTVSKAWESGKAYLYRFEYTD